MLAELCWRPEQLARQVDAFAAGHGRSERIHPRTPYKWLGGSQRLVLIPLALSEALRREVTAADLSGQPFLGGPSCTSSLRHLAAAR